MLAKNLETEYFITYLIVPLNLSPALIDIYPLYYRDTKEQTGCQVVFSHGIFYITELFWEILYKIICAVNCMKLILLDCRLCQIRLFSKHISLNFFTF